MYLSYDRQSAGAHTDPELEHSSPEDPMAPVPGADPDPDALPGADADPQVDPDR